MGKVYATLEPDLRDWLQHQHVFFVATAPLSRDGHINCSPKGGDCFRIVDDSTVAYLDRTGSGVETIAHLRENGRIVLMFCAFAGPPKIVRLHGRGEFLLPGTAPYDNLAALFPRVVAGCATSPDPLVGSADGGPRAWSGDAPPPAGRAGRRC